MVTTASRATGASEGPPVDRRVRLLLASLTAVGWPPLHARTLHQARREYRILAAAASSWRPLRSVADTTVPGPAGPIPVRIYRPRRRCDTPALVTYFHGGGFVVGDLLTADGVCRGLAEGSGATVVSVHYRRAPEHPLPAAHADAAAVARWALAHAAQLGADPARLVLAGDSAGGGLAAHVAQQLRDHGPARAALQVLFCPATDFTLTHTDRDPAMARLLDWATIDWFARHALPDGLDRTDPTISPLHAPDLSGLPPALVVTAGVDPFRADGIAYCAALRAAGVPARHRDHPGQIHGFVGMDLLFPAGRAAVREAAAAILAADPVPGPGPAGAPDSVPLGAAGHCGRLLRDTAQRLPAVNGWQMATTLLDHHLRSAFTERGHR